MNESATASVTKARRRPLKPGRILAGALILAFSLVYLVPLYWMLTGSFETAINTLKIPPDIFPAHPTLNNYIRLIFESDAPRWFLNSLITATVSAFGAVICASMAGYILGTRSFPGSRVIFWAIVASIALPTAVVLIPRYLLMRDVGWIDTYQGLIAPEIVYPFGVFLITQFMYTVPHDLLDAARIDGASEWATFRRVALPLIRPAVGAVAIFAFINAWTDYIWQIVIINSEQMQTLPVGVTITGAGYEHTDYGIAMAGATLAFLPMVAIFLAFRSYFTVGITTGAVR
jgi:multiple sugar transport system permease protein